jgi:RNA polymerase sigma-70 factor, ECF subfamily
MVQPAFDYQGVDEASLVMHARNGDREAFRAIMQRCNQRLFRVARAVLRNDDEAEDAVQEAYLHAFEAIGAFRGEAGLLTWLTSITLNEARGRLRKQRPTVDFNTMDELGSHVVPFPGMAAAPDPEAETARSQIRGLLEKAIDALPDDFRIVFIMREVEGCSMEETSAQLDLKPQTVKTRMFRARQMLRKQLEQELLTGVNTVFPFLGPRCARITERVLERLGRDQGCSGT